MLLERVFNPRAESTPPSNPEVHTMLRWAIAFAILALIAGLLGFSGLAGDFAYIAKILLLVFVVLFLIALIAGRAVLGGPTP